MRKIRYNVFETNSSSTHSVCITNPFLVLNELPIVNDWRYCDGEDTILVDLEGFCSYCDHKSQMEKMAYVILQLVYITDNSDAIGYYDCDDDLLEKFYETEEFKEFENDICEYVGCKHVRINRETGGYIDHESVIYDIDELKNWDLNGFGYVGFIYAADSYVHFEHIG